MQSNVNPTEEFDKWHSRSQNRVENDSPPDESPSDASSPPSSSASSDKGDAVSAGSPTGSIITSPSNVYPISIQLPAKNTRDVPSSQSSFYDSSPLSTPSPCLMTPTEEYSHPHISIAGQSEASVDYDLTSMFLSYPGLMGCDDNVYPLSKGNKPDESCFIKQHGGHCGCLHESSSYNVVLELSLRLRKAADVLARSASHHMGSNCLLNQRICDLDTFATYVILFAVHMTVTDLEGHRNALGNITAPPEDFSGSIPMSAQDRLRPNNMAGIIVHPAHVYGPNSCRPMSGSTISPQSLHSLRSWDLMPTASGSPGMACDDSFMSWEPLRRT